MSDNIEGLTATDEDVEGHKAWLTDDSDDVEGHLKARVTDDSDDDVEGHRA